MNSTKYRIFPLLLSIAFLLAAIAVEMTILLKLNGGRFIYTIDDPYIHLAFAENVSRGHFGINIEEVSAPSSSILWPFLLAPFAALKVGEYVPLIINLLSGLGTVLIGWMILDYCVQVKPMKVKAFIVSLLLILFILGANIIGLIFTGMEHSLQLFLVVLMAWGWMREIETRNVKHWWIAAIILAPLIRYESLAISAAAIVYLFYRRAYRQALFAAGLTAVLIGGYSILLTNLGLGMMPSSVLAKSMVTATGGNVWALLSNLQSSLSSAPGTWLTGMMLFLIGFSLFSNRRPNKRMFAGLTAGAIFLHLLVGRYGGYNRYELYIWGFSWAVLFYLGSATLSEYLTAHPDWRGVGKVILLASISVGMSASLYIYHLLSIPLGSNNIYQQQYQMHRFVTEYYQAPVAVNDLGWVSYQNEHYVLDLVGLGSLAALRHRQEGSSVQWMDDLAAAHEVELAMIYDAWFPNVPQNWGKVGQLYLGNRQVTPSEPVVTFYALNQDARQKVVDQLIDFRESLPNGVPLLVDESP